MKLLPVAKWEFEDAANTGKDSMGNYNLGKVAKEGGDLNNAYGTGTIQNGRLYLNGQDALACPSLNDVGDNIENGFTLNFQFQADGLKTERGAPVSFGFNDWSVSNACFFFSAGNERGSGQRTSRIRIRPIRIFSGVPSCLKTRRIIRCTTLR